VAAGGTCRVAAVVGCLSVRDQDWSKAGFTWRATAIDLPSNGALRIHSYHPAPYLSADSFSEIQYAKWSTTELYARCLLTLGKHFELDPYCEHENNTGEGPNQQVKAGGLILNLYY
jgi:hypothetical protein